MSSSDDYEDTTDVEDVQRERAYAQAEKEQTKRRLLAPPPAKKAKYTPLALTATPARALLAELDQTNPWVTAANQVLLGVGVLAAAASAAAPAEAVSSSVVVVPPKEKAPASAKAAEPKAPTKVLVRDKKTGKLTGKIDNVVRREQPLSAAPWGRTAT